MPGPVSDSYDPEFGTVANAADVREAIEGIVETSTTVLGPKLQHIVSVVQGEPGRTIPRTLTEREWRIIRFACNRALRLALLEHADTSRHVVKRCATMGNMVNCEVCGKKVKKQGLGAHKYQAHGNGRRSRSKVHPSAAISDGNGCAACLFRGLGRHVDRELVAEAVRGGMGPSAAAAFVRRVRETR